ncbi:LysR family transcriptional regulator [uncultured Stenotrophomonas sp.]|uniref:LysR family transcriptional regulator n=1 Tax=uncultured Stenotrophomonas sp. TaxID=165438 RepID=UPI0025FE1F4E|nr:LysR family transcriptional regulator [uncultured Stenotrophomonas sp.]
MNVSDARVFIGVVELKSLSAAGRQLGQSPMYVSRRVAALEEELGSRLLHRTTRSVSLTPEGEAFFPYAVAMVEAEEAAKLRLGQGPGSVTGTLKVSAPAVIGQAAVVPVIARMLEEHEGLSAEIDLSDSVFDIVGRGYDLAIRVATLRDSALVARKLADNPRVLVASPDYLDRMGLPKVLADLAIHECIQLTPVGSWPVMVQGELQRIPIKGRLSATSVEATRAGALRGRGLALLTYWDVKHCLEDRSLVQVHLADCGMEPLAIWAVTPSRRYLPTRVTAFLDALALQLGSAEGRQPEGRG